MSDCSILVVSHNTKRFTELCLKGAVSLAAVSRIYVVDNGSTDGSLEMLRSASRQNKLSLIERHAAFNASAHGSAIDSFLKRGIVTPWLLLLDSDCLPLLYGFDRKLIEMAGGTYDVLGTVHFRDGTLVHPSTMLISKNVLESPASKVSFVLKNRPEAFMDTGMAFGLSVKQAGFKIKAISREEMSGIVRHRWCATRAEVARSGGREKLDETPLAAFDKETDTWFRDPVAQETARLEL